jgi:phenylalanyl-tRNA synthetase beta chain
VPETLTYAQVRRALNEALPKEVRRFFPIDLYRDEKLGNEMSLTLRFMIASMEKTLEEAEINAMMERILSILQTACGARLR